MIVRRLPTDLRPVQPEYCAAAGSVQAQFNSVLYNHYKTPQKKYAYRMDWWTFTRRE